MAHIQNKSTLYTYPPPLPIPIPNLKPKHNNSRPLRLDLTQHLPLGALRSRRDQSPAEHGAQHAPQDAVQGLRNVANAGVQTGPVDERVDPLGDLGDVFLYTVTSSSAYAPGPGSGSLHLREGPRAPGTHGDSARGFGNGEDESRTAVDEVKEDLSAAGPAGGGPHPCAKGGNASEEDEEPAVWDVVGWVGVAEGDDAVGFGEDFMRECGVG